MIVLHDRKFVCRQVWDEYESWLYVGVYVCVWLCGKQYFSGSFILICVPNLCVVLRVLQNHKSGFYETWHKLSINNGTSAVRKR
jgi:hypothetical protein